MINWLKKIFSSSDKKSEIIKPLGLQPSKKVEKQPDCLDLKGQPNKKAGRPKSADVKKKTEVKAVKPKVTPVKKTSK
jgi:hypothetical protein